MVKRRSSILYLLLALWLVGAFNALKAEVSAYTIIPGLLRMGADERAAYAGGPLYNLSKEALRIVPESSVIYLFNPPVEAASNYSGKARYYLYPRKVVAVNAGDALPALKSGDFLMLFAPPEFADSPFVSGFKGLVPSVPEYEHSGDKGYQALLRVL